MKGGNVKSLELVLVADQTRAKGYTKTRKK